MVPGTEAFSVTFLLCSRVWEEEGVWEGRGGGG